MFEPDSRYFRIQTAEHVAEDGRTTVYVKRRFLPQGKKLALLVEAAMSEGDRLDLVTARTLGNPEHFWRVADANNAMNPFDLIQQPGSSLRVPVPTVEDPK